MPRNLAWRLALNPCLCILHHVTLGAGVAVTQFPLLSHSDGAWQQQTIAAHDDSYFPAHTEAFIADVMKEWHLPGIAIAIVTHNTTVSKGYGHALLPDIPVTPETLFYCGSTTKSFTAAAMSLLVDDDQDFPHVQWTTPMSQLLPDDFVLSDDWATKHITIEDALSHRTGYPGHTLGINNTSPREAVRRLRHLPMSAEPRTTYQYSNYMFTAVGHLIETLTGQQWLGDFFRDRIWAPLGMHHTYLTREDAEASGLQLAGEFRWHNDTESFVHVPHLPNGRGREAAGMVISNVQDYALYLRAMMAESGPLSKAGHAAIKEPRTIMGYGGPAYTGPMYYGFGWAGGVIEGEPFWFHNGQIREHVSQMWMFPERDFALVTLANADSPAPDIIAWKLIYDVLGGTHKQWSMEDTARRKVKTKEVALETCASRLYPGVPVPKIPRPVPLEKFTGIFYDPGYGNTSIVLECSGDDPFPEGVTPIHLERENNCYLKTEMAMGLEGRPIHIVFEHITGDFWVGWVVIEEYPISGEVGQQRPEACMRAEFRLDAEGNVREVGLDVRQEDESGPLVWFERVK
ncbi:beta-lactamase/transpeptidase-like protein [Xylariales sp. PMI_506]|nr:beta-lactamase/transpeptidase-like protein [Xylariales sp. PMI_506]